MHEISSAQKEVRHDKSVKLFPARLGISEARSGTKASGMDGGAESPGEKPGAICPNVSVTMGKSDGRSKDDN